MIYNFQMDSFELLGRVYFKIGSKYAQKTFSLRCTTNNVSYNYPVFRIITAVNDLCKVLNKFFQNRYLNICLEKLNILDTYLKISLLHNV